MWVVSPPAVGVFPTDATPLANASVDVIALRACDWPFTASWRAVMRTAVAIDTASVPMAVSKLAHARMIEATSPADVGMGNYGSRTSSVTVMTTPGARS